MNNNCVFCKIVSGEIPSAKVFETDTVFSFLDINPINPGHLLVIPKKHYTTIFEIPNDCLSELIIVVKNLSSVVYKATEAEGINVIQNNFRAAGQLVEHAHFHIIPRYKKDGFLTSWPGKPIAQKDLNDMLKKITGVM